jgi:hypothetical protein
VPISVVFAFFNGAVGLLSASVHENIAAIPTTAPETKASRTALAARLGFCETVFERICPPSWVLQRSVIATVSLPFSVVGRFSVEKPDFARWPRDQDAFIGRNYGFFVRREDTSTASDS